MTPNIVSVIILGLLMAPQKDNAGAGNLAREMAAAPLKRDEPGEPVVSKGPTLSEGNRFRNIFGRVIFKAASAAGKVYGGDRETDRLTKKLASVEIEFGTSKFFAKGKVQAVQPKTGDADAYPEFLFQASQYAGQALHSDDPGCQADLQEYREYVLDLFDEWQATGANTSGPVAAKKARKLTGVSLR